MKDRYTLPVLLLVFVILAAGIVAAGGLLYRSQQDHLQTEVEHNLTAIADLKVSELSVWRKERLKDAGIFYKNSAFSALVRRCIEQPQDLPLQEELRTWIGHFQVRDQYDQVTLLDAAGNKWISFPDAKEPRSSVTTEKAREALRSGQLTFEDFRRHEYTQKVYLRLFVPILDGPSGGRPLGVLMLRIDPNVYLNPFIQRWPTPSETAESMLIRREGNEFVFLNNIKNQKNTALILRVSLDRTDLPAVKAALGQKGIVEGVDYRGVPVLTAARAVPDSPWFLVVKIDAAEVYAPMRKWLWLTVLIVVVLLFGAAVTVGLFWRRQHAVLYREMYEAEQKYRAIVETSADGILMADVETKMLKYPNPALCRMLGYTERELNTMSLADLHPKDALQNVMVEFESQVRGDKNLAMNIPCICKDGVIVRVDIKTTTATIGGRNCLVGVFRDTTEQKQAEEALRESEEWYKTLFVEAQDGISVVDAKTGLIIDCNQALTALVGRDKAELIGQSQKILHPPVEDDEPFSPTFKQHLGDQAGQVLDTQVVTKTGEVKEVAIRARTVNLAGKKVMQGLFRDITDSKRAEEQALIFRRFAEASGQGLGMATLQGQILYMNQTLCRMLDEDNLEDVYNKRFPEYYPPEFRERLLNEVLPKVMSGGQWVGELALISTKGKQIPTIENFFLIRDEEGRPLRLADVVTDITERKQMEDELRKAKDAAEAANRAKSEFLANMSHEIRTPMTAILGYADLIFDENLGRAAREHVAVIKRNGEHLLGLISDILDLSKIETGKLQIEPTRCSPVQLVGEVASLMRSRATAKQLKLKTEFASILPETVLTDPLRLRQVLINLLGNAIKFTDQGEIRLAVRLIADCVSPRLQLEVADTGIGMTEEQMRRLFKPFTQVDSSSTRKFGGTGLGLCISKHLAEALGGDIEVRSTPGEGSAFIVTIDPGPLDGIQMIRNAHESLLDRQPTTTGATPVKTVLHGRILLAEDGLDNQQLIAALLTKAGAEVTAVEDGRLAVEAALAALETGQPFKVILMDMQMPVMDGYEATRQLRSRGSTGPIVALTAHAMAEDCQKCLDAGCDDYLTKPIDRQRLLSTVACWAANPCVTRLS